MTTNALVRIVSKLDVRGPSECWLWRGKLREGAYPDVHVAADEATRLGFRPGSVIASRYVAALFKGRVARGVVVMHGCDNPLCLNPNHLTLASQQENIRDAMNKGRLRRRGTRRLSAAQVSDVRTRVTRGETSRAIAGALGLSLRTVRAVALGQTYREAGGQS